MEHLPLFVFGTLRRGQRNHPLLEGRYERMLPARLRGFAKIELLMIAREDGESVDGELYFLRRDVFDEAMAGCDRLEGIPPGLDAGPEYRRMRVTVETAEGERAAWAYVHPDTIPAAK